MRPLAYLFASTLPIVLLAPACDDGGGLDPGSHHVELVQYASCGDLEQDLKERAYQELEAYLTSWSWGWYGEGDTGGPAAPGGDSADEGSGGGRDEGTDYSGTNNQEDGVDEADLVKTDGYRIYLVNGNRLHVFGVPEFGQLVSLSETELEGIPAQLLLDADRSRVAVFSMVPVDQLPEDHPMRAKVGAARDGIDWYWRTWALSKITILDVSDPAAPALEREVWLEGWYQTARRTDHSVRVVANGHIFVPGIDDLWTLAYDADGNLRDVDEIRALAHARIDAADLTDLIPRMYRREADGTVTDLSLAGSSCRSFYFPTNSAGRSTTSIVSFDLASPELAFDADTVVSNWATVYASVDRLYLAEWAWDWWWGVNEVEPGEIFQPATNIHAFDISDPGRSHYTGSGRIDGTVINQFSLDEQDGLLRVAATTTPWRMWSEDPDVNDDPAPPPESHVYILEEGVGGLHQIGHLGGIAPGERMFSSRFTADKAYLVTFEQVDPLFTIDLSNARAPQLAGELDVFGFSTYLHPIADDRILAIGVGGDENGANWQTQVSLFDVSNMAAPALVDDESLVTEGWGWSEALYEHKAFQYFAPKKLLAVPFSSYTESYDGEEYTYDWSSRLALLRVDPDSGLSLAGSVDHSRFYGTDWWGMPEVRRSIFMGDYIYAISARAITAHSLDGLTEVAAEELPGPTDQYWWWY
ncbi:MAG TPA: beta-propeller domain-containing protein [Kofleriaceae bacterium]